MKKVAARAISARLMKYVTRVLRNNDVALIVVTGSIGKTSTRVAVSKLLSHKFKQPPLTENSYNVPVAVEMNFFGLELPSPLWNAAAWPKIFKQVRTLAHKYPYDAVVLEINEDDLDLLQKFVAKLHPHIAVITGVAPVHMAKLKTMSRVVEQTTSIAKYAEQVVYNSDFTPLKALADQQNSISYGLKKDAQVRLENVMRGKDDLLSFELVLIGSDEKAKQIKTKMIADQSLASLAAAAAVGELCGMTKAEITAALSKIGPVRGRMNPLQARNGAIIIDDSYNSSPVAVQAALKTLAEVKAKRRIAVLGSMNELGSQAKAAHEQIGRQAAKNVNILITVGALAEQYLAPAGVRAGLAKDQVKIFRTPYEAGHYLKAQLKTGDVVLIKGSQNGVFTEEVARIILEEKLNPAEVLVRQSEAWRRKKKIAFRQ